jgi:hypothetical protein
MSKKLIRCQHEETEKHTLTRMVDKKKQLTNRAA